MGNVVPRQLFETQYRALVDLLCQRWGLERGHGPIRHGYNAVVIPVRRSSEPLVLKLNWPALGVSEEVRGLEAWEGNGMVWMLAADASVGALLLERLDADCTLREMDAMEAVRVAGRLLRPLLACDVLILDELGYLPATPGFGPLLYEIVAERYERRPIIVTSNKNLTEWSNITQDASLAAAIADQLLHHGEVFYLKGLSCS